MSSSFFGYFFTFMLNKMFQEHIVLSLSQPWIQPLFQGVLDHFSGEQYSEATLWVLGVLITTRGSLLPGQVFFLSTLRSLAPIVSIYLLNLPVCHQSPDLMADWDITPHWGQRVVEMRPLPVSQLHFSSHYNVWIALCQYKAHEILFFNSFLFFMQKRVYLKLGIPLI